jgi:hypothetical protein
MTKPRCGSSTPIAAACECNSACQSRERLEPLMVKIDFDARAIEQIIKRLTVLRARMLPAPSKPPQQN